jgi:signal transduction histidine kinase/ActR/RegA family two-component response regulator
VSSSERPPTAEPQERERLERCIRDLAALNALPSMCVGRSPDEAFAIVADALPVALGCNLVCLSVPGATPRHGGWLDRAPLTATEIAGLLDATHVDGSDAILYCRNRKLFCLQLDIPIGRDTGQLVAGRFAPLDPASDRMLFRSAANLVGTALEAANVLENARRKDDFIAMLGHELRNPLASILAAAELLEKKAFAEREQRVIERHARHLARLVDDLLDLSRIGRGQLELRNEHVPLATVLERAAEIAEAVVRERHHTLRIADSAGICLFGDAVRLAQIFGNLLTNAAKFTPPGGEIVVSIERTNERVQVSVTDNGRGLAREQLARIFEPFVQVDRDSGALSGGLGLGLAIVRTLVERHGGTIVAESDGPGHGSTFKVRLPAVQHAPRLAPVNSKPPKRTRAGMRVLIVDDNVDMAQLLSTGLGMEGFETAETNDAATAIERWRTFRPHAAILDVGLPDMDGYVLARELRKEHGTEPLLIAATGYGRESDRIRASEAGFDLHLVKPVSLAQLVDTLDERSALMQSKDGAPLAAREDPTEV